MMYFKHEFRDDTFHQPNSSIEYRTEAVVLDEVLAAFKDFLQGCGYNIKGDLIVWDESNDSGR
jgi:Zn-dependent M28 family amino/carboxypeptidase